MAKLQINQFSEWELTESELKSAVQFTVLNRCYIQNMLAQAAQEKNLLEVDAVNPLLYVQREAELQGRIRVLQQLLEVSTPEGN